MGEFGDKVRKIRKSKNMSLRELGRQVGVSAMFLSDLEHGNRWPSNGVLKKINKIFGRKLLMTRKCPMCGAVKRI